MLKVPFKTRLPTSAARNSFLLTLAAGLGACSDTEKNTPQQSARNVAADGGAGEHDGGTLAERGSGEELSLARLGELLYSDINLSANRHQACSTCHDPEVAFCDPRLDPQGKRLAASIGDDQTSLGDRNAPSTAYASYVPSFSEGRRERHNTDSDLAEYRGYLGGLFHDGRAMSLEEQAAGPPLNPVEMAMRDEGSVVARIMDSPDYVASFESHFGEEVWDDPQGAYAALTKAIAEFERTALFAPFDSKYDRSLLPASNELRYTYHPASKAAAGKALFFSAEFSNCAACHQLHPQGSAMAREEVFTGFEYHNLGVPENTALREANGAPRDLGLGARLDEHSERGKFRTPTLRNVALTAPYMHNGVFQELTTVIRFYEHQKRVARGDGDASENPETGEAWRAPEVNENLSSSELKNGSKDLADEENVAALTCFLLSLTDARYEPLLDPDQVERCGL